MEQLPEDFMAQIRAQLPNEAESLFASLDTPAPVSIRTNPSKPFSTNYLTPVPWSENGYYLPQRPLFTADPLLHGGAYYVQEAGSQFIDFLIRQLYKDTVHPVSALDLCASPGGKTTLLASALPPGSLVVANEVISSRVSPLMENAIKWGTGNIAVTSAQGQAFGALGQTFDLIAVDAPCSGEGLFRREPASRAQWSAANVKLCAARQKSILTDVWPALKEGGILLYSTCTYNQEEDEQNVQWIFDHFDAQPLQIDCPDTYRVLQTQARGTSCFRFMPHRTPSEGFFVAVLRKTGSKGPQKEEKTDRKRRNNPATFNILGVPQRNIWEGLLQNEQELVLTERSGLVNAIPTPHFDTLREIATQVRIVCCGTALGENKKKNIIPAQSLALSTHLNREAFPTISLHYEQALSYLHKDNLVPQGNEQGWHLLDFAGIPLGWGKYMGHRMNNYYPVEWRIRRWIEKKEFFSLTPSI